MAAPPARPLCLPAPPSSQLCGRWREAGPAEGPWRRGPDALPGGERPGTFGQRKDPDARRVLFAGDGRRPLQRGFINSLRSPPPLPAAPGRRLWPGVPAGPPGTGARGDGWMQTGEGAEGGGAGASSILLGLPSVPSPTEPPALQGPGFLPLSNKLRNLQRPLDPRTRRRQLGDIVFLVRTTVLGEDHSPWLRTTALGQVTKAGSGSIAAPWSHIYRVRMATG